MRRRLLFRVVPAALGGLLVSLAYVAPASAAEVVTPYPGVAVEAGGTATFDLQVLSNVREPVDLQVTQAPDGWSTVIRGGGRQVESVYTNPDSPPEVQLEVQVPANASAGAHDVTVAANAASGNSTLDLTLRVVQQAADAFELTTEFPTLQGSSSDTFAFDLTLANRTAQEATFSLAANGPQGWTIEARPATEQQAATVAVDAGGEATINVQADPPDEVTAGTYEVGVAATGEGTELTSQLTVEVTGSTSFSVTTSNERLNTSGAAGDEQTLTMVVTNDGNAPLEGVELSADPPQDWNVEFEPSTLDAIPPGESARATARITPSGDAIAGDYVVTMNAGAGSATENVEIRYSVETSGWWGLVGALVIAAAVATLIGVYRRYGRR